MMEEVRNFTEQDFFMPICQLLRREIFPDIDLYYGPTMQFFSVDSNENRDRVILKPEEIGLDTSNFSGRRIMQVSMRKLSDRQQQ